MVRQCIRNIISSMHKFAMPLSPLSKPSHLITFPPITPNIPTVIMPTAHIQYPSHYLLSSFTYPQYPFLPLLSITHPTIHSPFISFLSSLVHEIYVHPPLASFQSFPLKSIFHDYQTHFPLSPITHFTKDIHALHTHQSSCMGSRQCGCRLG